ncbi:hypothetical protein DXG01_002798 [Tephrocybe rancida]|nr:hypothetical protein DXG01_002798 [Tephrocybe rancida]
MMGVDGGRKADEVYPQKQAFDIRKDKGITPWWEFTEEDVRIQAGRIHCSVLQDSTCGKEALLSGLIEANIQENHRYHLEELEGWESQRPKKSSSAISEGSDSEMDEFGE